MEQTVAGIIRHHAAARRDHDALVFGKRRITYGELDRHASQVAQGLLAEGLAPQARVAVLDKNSDGFFEILFGAAKARAVLVAVNWRLASPEVAYVLNDAGAEILFVGPEFLPVVGKIRDELGSVRRVIALAEAEPAVPAAAELARWERYPAWRNRQRERDPQLPIPADDVALQMYTSGTTGHPKGAQLTHANLLSHFPVAIREWGRPWTPEEVVLVCMPIFHIGGSGWALVGFYAGTRVVVVREVLPGEIGDPVERVSRIRSFVVRVSYRAPGERLRRVVSGDRPGADSSPAGPVDQNRSAGCGQARPSGSRRRPDPDPRAGRGRGGRAGPRALSRGCPP
jgi:acyl-CoA synthetase (AMP-forming)/AMP-acid ligase II